MKLIFLISLSLSASVMAIEVPVTTPKTNHVSSMWNNHINEAIKKMGGDIVLFKGCQLDVLRDEILGMVKISGTNGLTPEILSKCEEFLKIRKTMEDQK